MVAACAPPLPTPHMSGQSRQPDGAPTQAGAAAWCCRAAHPVHTAQQGARPGAHRSSNNNNNSSNSSSHNSSSGRSSRGVRTGSHCVGGPPLILAPRGWLQWQPWQYSLCAALRVLGTEAEKLQQLPPLTCPLESALCCGSSARRWCLRPRWCCIRCESWIGKPTCCADGTNFGQPVVVTNSTRICAFLGEWGWGGGAYTGVVGLGEFKKQKLPPQLGRCVWTGEECSRTGSTAKEKSQTDTRDEGEKGATDTQHYTNTHTYTYTQTRAGSGRQAGPRDTMWTVVYERQSVGIDRCLIANR
jgi:hypothetical protein